MGCFPDAFPVSIWGSDDALSYWFHWLW